MTIEKVFNIIVDAYELSKDHFFGPENRIYHLYLLSSLILALISWAVIPYYEGAVLADLNIGLL